MTSQSDLDRCSKFREKIKHSHYSLLAEQPEDYRQTLNESRRLAQTVTLSTQTSETAQSRTYDWQKLISRLNPAERRSQQQ